MAFVLEDLKTSTFEWKVEFEIPQNGYRSKHDFNAVFKRISQTEYEELNRKQKEEGYPDNSVVKDIMVGWSNMLDSENKEVPFTKNNLDKLLDILGMAAYIIKAFGNAHAGELKEKN